MKLLFCNVGWMDKYEGIVGDSIARGGSYNKDSVGHEVCNFSAVGGVVYGYVQANSQIRIERLGGGRAGSFVDGVTVVWTASPPTGRTVVVGWYKNATVYRVSQPIPKLSALHARNGVKHYRIEANHSDAVRVPLVLRDRLRIPRGVKGGIGMSNVWYADTPESKGTVRKVVRYINSWQPPLDTVDVVLPRHELPGPAGLADAKRGKTAAYVKQLAAIRTWLVGIARVRATVTLRDIAAVFGLGAQGASFARAALTKQSSDRGEPLISSLIVHPRTKRNS